MLFLGTTVYGLQTGLCFAILALGLYISYSILDFPDLSVDGTFPFGAAVSTVAMLKFGLSPILSLVLSFVFGMIAGTVTGILHVKAKISKLLSGIIVMTAFLSINLALTQLMTPNGYTTTTLSFKGAGLRGLFGGEFVSSFGKEYKDYVIIAILIVFVIVSKLIIDIFLKTKLGYMLRSTGENEKTVISLGKDPGNYKILGLSLANGFVALSGALYTQFSMSYDNNCGSGKVVLALASVIIGMALFSGSRRIANTTSVIIGAVIYSLCLNYLVLIDTNGIYLKLLNSVMFTLILIMNDKIMGLRLSFNKKQMMKGDKINADS